MKYRVVIVDDKVEGGRLEYESERPKCLVFKRPERTVYVYLNCDAEDIEPKSIKWDGYIVEKE